MNSRVQSRDMSSFHPGPLLPLIVMSIITCSPFASSTPHLLLLVQGLVIKIRKGQGGKWLTTLICYCFSKKYGCFPWIQPTWNHISMVRKRRGRRKGGRRGERKGLCMEGL